MPNTNDQIFSMNDLANAIANAMVAAQTRTETESQVVTQVVQSTNIPDGYIFARHSQFYGKVMNDGMIFNPYLNRRWVGPQFLKIMKRYNLNVSKGITKSYSYTYMINHFVKEINKMAFLCKKDLIAYQERLYMLPLVDAKEIIIDYCGQLKNALADSQELTGSTKLNREFYGKLPGGYYFKKGKYEEKIINHKVERVLVMSTEYKNLIDRIDMLIADVNRTYSYKRLAELVNAFRFIKFDNGKMCQAMKESFLKTGAFYTLRMLIEFEGLNFSSDRVRCTNPVDSARELKAIIGEPGYVIYAILKKTIADNNYTY